MTSKLKLTAARLGLKITTSNGYVVRGGALGFKLVISNPSIGIHAFEIYRTREGEIIQISRPFISKVINALEIDPVPLLARRGPCIYWAD